MTNTNNNAMPVGIRKRGEAYQAIITKCSKQYSATFQDLEQAIKWRQEKLQDLNKDTSATGRTCTLQEAIQRTIETRWADTKAERTSTLNAYNIMRFFGPHVKLTSLTTQEIERFITNQKQQGLSNATINRKLACLSVILKTSEDNGYTTGNPKLIRRKEYKGRDRYLTSAEEETIIKLFTQFNQNENLDIFLCLLDTGMRISELLNLQYRDIAFTQGKHGVINVYKTKNNRPRGIPMTERVNAILKKRLSNTDSNTGQRIFPNSTQSSFRVAWDRIRVLMNLDNDPQFVPHILRHTCASRLVSKGVPLAVIQQWLGHLSIQSTMRYSHLAPTALYQYVE